MVTYAGIALLSPLAGEGEGGPAIDTELVARAPSVTLSVTLLRRRGRGPAIAVAAVLVSCAMKPAVGQDYPARPITLIVPYAAGGGNDAMARPIADRMGAALGGRIIIEDRGGAGGSIATREIAHAAPDGYTLGLGGTGTLAVDPTFYPHVGYDPRKDFAPVGLIATSAMVFLVNPKVPAKTLKDFIALAKSKPGRLNFASAGSGSGMHLGTELFD